MASQQVTTKFQDFIPSDLTFTKFEENERSKGQNLGYPRYKKDGQRLMLQGPKIKLNSYGVPQAGDYYPTDSSRAFIKVPLDLSNPEVKEFYEKLKGIDEVMESDAFKTEQFGKDKKKKYKYMPIVRVPEEEPDAEDDPKKKKYPRPPYAKFKLNVTWPETKITTEVFISTMKDGKRERTKQEINSIDEFASHVRFNSTIRPIITPVKSWCEKKVKQGSDYMLYGVTFKIIKIEVEPPENNNSLLSTYLNNDAFIDSDDEEPSFQGKPSAPINTAKLPLVKSSTVKKHVVDDEEDEDEDPKAAESEEESEAEESEQEESEEEEEPIPEPPKPKGKAAPPKASSTKKK
jgi:hypothetical protein